MAHIPPVESAKASQPIRDLYDDFSRRMRFPSAPNFILTQGHSQTVAQGSWDLVRNVLVSGLIPRWAKEMMFAAISLDRDCRYCAAAHLACCRMLGVSPELLDSLVQDINSLDDPKLRDMILFAVKCARDPQGLTDNDFRSLREHGLLDAELIEVIAMAGVAVYANILADATRMEPDAVFAEL